MSCLQARCPKQVRPAGGDTCERAWRMRRRGPGWLLHAMLQDVLLVPAVRAFGRPYVAHGAECLAGLEGPAVVVANHASHLDAPAILAALPPGVRRRTRVGAADDYFYRDRLLGLGVTLAIGAFPFPRRGNQGLERAAGLLADGCCVLLFPEGTRSADGSQGTFRDGVGRLLLGSGAPVVPVAVQGSHALWPRGRRLPRRGPLAVHVGTPWRPAAGLSPREIGTELARRVAALAATPRLSAPSRSHPAH